MAKQFTCTLTLPNGKRKYFRGATKKEAERKREEAKRDIDRGLDISVSPTVEEFTKVWLTEYKKGVIRDTSYMMLDSILRSHVIPEIGRMKIREVKPAHIQRMMRAMEDKAKSTQARTLTATRSLFKAAMENDLIVKNPCVSSIRPRGEDTEEKMPLTPEQEKLLLDKVKGTNMYLFVLLGLNAGLRHGELLGLQWSDFDFNTGVVTVQRSVVRTIENRRGELSTEMKTAAAHRSIPLPWSVINEVRDEMAKSHSVYVIPGKRGEPLALSTSSQRWYRMMKKLPFDTTPHRMRHTRITRWFEQGLDLKEIQYLAGHATSNVTLDIYTHYQEEVRIQNTAKKIQAV